MEALELKAGRRSEQAESAGEAEQRAAAQLPPGGEPIKIGHHSGGAASASARESPSAPRTGCVSRGGCEGST
ncbi:DUF3560 domain-containing protein [Rhodococcus erythropolis]|uniref:DUF3560 domain-containing protein n=1 Tax=Rhodococcus erythropolis TaxID=1833 RepID=UPI0029495F35|nr:DUF3560 domain-containing protein [Rhodococcus erythropolis]MDV6278696.1 DUF3560 domain-containing protein [Rhodococcus erythropolis]